LTFKDDLDAIEEELEASQANIQKISGVLMRLIPKIKEIDQRVSRLETKAARTKKPR